MIPRQVYGRCGAIGRKWDPAQRDTGWSYSVIARGTMRLTAIKFSGYQSGQTEFAPVFQAAGETEREQILSVVERLADQIIEADSSQFTSIIVTGHADRQDRSDLGCDQRRASEIAAPEIAPCRHGSG